MKGTNLEKRDQKHTSFHTFLKVRKLFERFGPVTNVIKPEDHVAFVVMGRFADAKTAKKHLDLSW